MWLAGAVWALSSSNKVAPRWLAFIWLGLGLLIIWGFVAKPILLTRQMRLNTPPKQQLKVKFDGSGIHVEAPGVGDYYRAWQDIVLLLPAKNGFGFIFRERPNHWLPNRVFSTPLQRDEFVQFVNERVAEAELTSGA
jgi:hypothetical protein